MLASLPRQRRRRPVRSQSPLVVVGAMAMVATIALATYPSDLEIIRRSAVAASAERLGVWSAPRDDVKGRAWECRPTSVLEAYSIARRRC